jgi:hypothetical protein
MNAFSTIFLSVPRQSTETSRQPLSNEQRRASQLPDGRSQHPHQRAGSPRCLPRPRPEWKHPFVRHLLLDQMFDCGFRVTASSKAPGHSALHIGLLSTLFRVISRCELRRQVPHLMAATSAAARQFRDGWNGAAPAALSGEQTSNRQYDR